jgi:serine/threonine protein kinase
MSRTKKNFRNKGGKVITSGGYGCVFDPALKCEGETKRAKNKITKLMTDKYATQEYEEINSIKEKLDEIPNYFDYYLINDVTLCRPSKLTATDLEHFSDKCTALPKNDINKNNINQKLESVMALNLPNGGIPVDDYIYKNGDYGKLYKTHMALVNLLKKGIIPMNNKNIYHSDIKDSNVLIEDVDSSLKARLIDWGLTVQYVPNSTVKFPKNWRNRPLQFNVPFSVIIFSDLFSVF